jgi:hypothetical protein
MIITTNLAFGKWPLQDGPDYDSSVIRGFA